MAKIQLWSGGMDSTLALFNLATDYPRDMIHAVTILNFGNSENQKKSEIKSRKLIKTDLKKRGITNISYHDIDVRTNFNTETQQAPLWFNYVMPNIKDGDELHMSYLSSDGWDFFYYKPLLENAFDSICKLRGIKATLHFPYVNWLKGEIIKDLKKFKLYKYTSYCGDPKNNLKPCGKCIKCQSVKRWQNYKKGVKV